MRFLHTTISRPGPEIILCRVLSEFPSYVLPLPCNAYVRMTSERRHGDSVTDIDIYPIDTVLPVHIVWHDEATAKSTTQDGGIA